MKHMRRLQQAYREFPWRKQVRRGVWVLAAVVTVAAVIALEVHLATQALVLNYQLQSRRRALWTAQQQVVVLQTRWAQLTSVDHLLRVAEREGYQPVSAAQEHFVPVPAGTLPPKAAPAWRPLPASPTTPGLPKAYTISLVRWLEHYFLLEPIP